MLTGALAIGLVACGGPGNPSEPSSAGALAIQLEGTAWRLESLGARDNPQSVLPGTAVSLEFAAARNESGRLPLAGSAGCNRYFGSTTTTTHMLAIGPLGATRMRCGTSGVMEQEAAYLAALEKGGRYEFQQPYLHILAEDGRTQLTFLAR